MMKKHSFYILVAMLLASASFAEVATDADGNVTTVDETSTTDDGVNLIGPTGVTGTIRRVDRRQDRRLESDIEDHLDRDVDIDLDGKRRR